MKSAIYKRALMDWWIYCLILPLIVFCGSSCREAAKSKEYTFSADWFLHNIPVWEKVLQPYKGKKGISYLEIGVFEGRSLLWMLDNILTHPTARATGIDIALRKELLDNLSISGAENKVKTIEGRSQAKLSLLQPNSFDIIYIDGSHAAAAVLADAVLSWPLLRNNGLMMFDDYLWNAKILPLELRPQVAIDAFITAHRNSLEIVYNSDSQRIFRKQAGGASYLSFGQYEYYWNEKNLYTAGKKELVPLSDKEKELIGKLFMGRGFGKIKFSPTPEMLLDADFVKLKERLKLVNLF